MSHDSKRILTPQYYAPKLPASSTPPNLTTNHDNKFQLPNQQQPSTSSFPDVPEDVQTKLLHIGMKVRRQVAEGHHSGSIPSYQPNYCSFKELEQKPFNRHIRPSSAGRNISAPAYINTETQPNIPGQGSRLQLKRNRADELDEEMENDDTDIDEDDEMYGETARRMVSEAAVQQRKVFYIPATRNSQFQSGSDVDFDEATFLASRESLG